jgi:hypothetical protein
LEPEQLLIKVGVWTIGKSGPKAEQVQPVAAVAIHPNYDSGSLVKDQAILVIEIPFTFDEHVDKICLPPTNSGEYPKTGRTCIATGWGKPNLQSKFPCI